MKEYTIIGQEECLGNFIDNADWLGIFNEFHCIMRKRTIDANTIVLSFGLGKTLWGYPTDRELSLTKRLKEECKKFKVTIQ